MKAFLVGLLLVCSLGGWWFAVIAPVSKEKPQPPVKATVIEKDRGREAWEFVKNGIYESLNAPATATFSDPDDKVRSAWEKGPGPVNSWYVRGHVDAQNAFGALLRRKWIAEVEDKDGQFKVLNLQLGNTYHDFVIGAEYEVKE